MNMKFASPVAYGIISIILISTVSVDARATRGGRATAAAGICDTGVADNGGCSFLVANGLLGSVQHTDLLTNSAYGPQSGQTYTALPPYPVPALTYGVGVPASMSLILKDPATANWTGTGCTYGSPAVYTATSGTGDPGAKWATFSGVSFTPTIMTYSSVAGNPASGQPFKINSGTAVSVGTTLGTQIDSTHWNLTGNSATGTGSVLAFSYGSAKVTCNTNGYVANNVEFGPIGGHGGTIWATTLASGSGTLQNSHFTTDSDTANAASQDPDLLRASGSNATLNLLNNTFDGNCNFLTCPFGALTPQWNGPGAITAKFNAFNSINRTAAGCSATCATVGDLDIENNYWQGVCAGCNQSVHGEVIEQLFSPNSTSIQANHKYIDNVTIVNYTEQSITADLYISGGANPSGPTYSNVELGQNVIITNCSIQLGGSGQCPNLNYKSTSALADFQNGIYTHANIHDNYVDGTGLSPFYWRTDCLNHTWMGALDSSAILTVTGFPAYNVNTGTRLINNNANFNQSKIGLADFTATGYTIGAQLTTTQQNATMNGVTVSGTVLSWTSYSFMSGTGVTAQSAIQPGMCVTGTGLSNVPGTCVTFVSQISNNGTTGSWNISANIASPPSTVFAGALSSSGTYQTNAPTGTPIASQTMYDYGAYSQASFPNGIQLSGNIDMVSGATHNTIDGETACFVQAP